jgi:hypothetical protein
VNDDPRRHSGRPVGTVAQEGTSAPGGPSCEDSPAPAGVIQATGPGARGGQPRTAGAREPPKNPAVTTCPTTSSPPADRSAPPGLRISPRPYPGQPLPIPRTRKCASGATKGQARASGAPGARTLNPRIKRGPLRRSEHPACTSVPGICPESTQCTAMRSVLVPRAVPRHPCQTRPPRLLNVTTRRRRRLGPWFLFHPHSGSIRRQPDRGGQQHAHMVDM